MEQLIRDLRFAVRSLQKSPGFTLAAVLCLALGLGASSAVFSVLNAVLLQPLPYDQPDRTVMIWGPGQGDEFRPSSAPELFDYQQQTAVFEAVVASVMSFLNHTGGEEPQRLVGTRVTPSFLELLGVDPAHGRLFHPGEGGPDQPPAALLGNGFWRRRFGADPAVVGRTILLNDEAFTVVGILPEGFHFKFGPVESDVLLPLALDPARPLPRNLRGFGIAARLRPGVTPEQAQAAVDALAARFRADYPESYPGDDWRIAVVPMTEVVVGSTVQSGLWVLFGAVGLLLLIACANVASLLLARATAREKEVALRSALGAGHSTLVRQFLAEAALLAVAGGALGLLVAVWAVRALVALDPGQLPRVAEISLDGRGLLFIAAASVLTVLLFGLVPALRAARGRSGLHDLLKAGGKTTSGATGRHRLRSALVVVEVALALVVLVLAGLMIRSFQRLQEVNPGFQPAGLLTFQVFLSPAKFPKDPDKAAVAAQVLERLRALPRVERAALVNGLPLTEVRVETDVLAEGRAPVAGEAPLTADWRSVSPDYFRVLGIALRRGRAFTASDAAGAPPVAVVDEALAERVWPGADPLGRRIQLKRPDGREIWLDVVGVVGTVLAGGLDTAAPGQVYTPFAQAPRPLLSVALRTAGEPLQVAGAVRSAVWSVDRELPVEKVQPMTDVVRESLAGRRSYTLLLAAFAAVSLVLAAIGVYGVLAYSVSQRVQEIGVRLSLGARRGQVLGLVVGQGLVLAAAGVGLGLLLALAGSRLLASLLFGVTATDAATFGGVALLLLALAALASWLPALRATRVDPVVALRPR